MCRCFVFTSRKNLNSCLIGLLLLKLVKDVSDNQKTRTNFYDLNSYSILTALCAFQSLKDDPGTTIKSPPSLTFLTKVPMTTIYLTCKFFRVPVISIALKLSQPQMNIVSIKSASFFNCLLCSQSNFINIQTRPAQYIHIAH